VKTAGANAMRPRSLRGGTLSRSRVWLLRAVVVLLCLFLVACSSTRLLYNQADWVIVWYLNGYFTLDDAQEDQLRDAVQRNFEWHRQTQLSKYAEFARQLEADADGFLTVEVLELRYERMIEFWDELLMHALPDVSAFFLTLTDEQVEEFIENLEDGNEELWEEYAGATPEERMERRQKSAVRGFKRGMGRLTDEQKEIIRSYMANMHDVSDYWMASRQRWQQDFKLLVLERPSEPEFSDRLMALTLDPNRTDEQGYRAKVEENREVFLAMAVALSEVLTDKQRKRFKDRMGKFARDFDKLAEQQS
jgi:hypothetical protein